MGLWQEEKNNELNKVIFIGWVDKTLKETLTKQNIKLSFRTTRIHDLLTFKLWITRQLQRFMHEQIKKGRWKKKYILDDKVYHNQQCEE